MSQSAAKTDGLRKDVALLPSTVCAHNSHELDGYQSSTAAEALKQLGRWTRAGVWGGDLLWVSEVSSRKKKF